MIFSHCGDTGDLIYAMHTIKLLGGGYLNLRNYYQVREPFTEQKVSKLMEFLSSQEYIKGILYNGSIEDEELILDRWREDGILMKEFNKRYNNIAVMHALVGKIKTYPQNESWLICKDPKNIADIVISRTLRYHNDVVYWDKILNGINLKEININYLYNFYKPNRHLNQDKHYRGKKYTYDADPINRDDVVFVGFKDEYDSFINKFGYIKYYPTDTFYELFQVIAGCKIFCGNQSAPMALAMGLGVPQIAQEVWLMSPNCRFNRDNTIYFE